VALSLLSALPTRAEYLSVGPELQRDVLAESNPGAFAIDDRTAADYDLAWDATPVAGVQARVVPDSLQWVRVAQVLTLPRGRVAVDVQGCEGGQIEHAGFVIPLEKRDGNGRAVLPAALLGRAAVDVVVQRGGETVRGRLRPVLRARAGVGGVHYDSSCSAWGVEVDTGGAPDWLEVGCRPIVSDGDKGRAGAVEFYPYWDGGDAFRLDGLPVQPRATSTVALHVRHEPAQVRLERLADGQPVATATIRWRVPERFYRLNLGAGIGPYLYSYEGLPGVDPVRTVTAVATVYGSWFLSETSRLVLFDLMPLHRRLYTDFGIYYNRESFRVLDRRVGVYVMLGAHALVVDGGERVVFKVRYPQGLEAIVRDFAMRGWNLSGGAFLYPDALGDAYYNVWLRYGSARGFFEFNYLEWQLVTGGWPLRSRALGVCFGMPVGRLF
jgi:hypothetical protein